MLTNHRQGGDADSLIDHAGGADVDFGVLGSLSVRDGARIVPVSAPRQRVLLAALLLSAGRVVSLDTLAETLWEGGSPAGARGALHSAVQRLRSTLGPAGASLIETRPPGDLIKAEDAGWISASSASWPPGATRPRRPGPGPRRPACCARPSGGGAENRLRMCLPRCCGTVRFRP